MSHSKTFIERTLYVLKQYEDIKKSFGESYAHTLFINCCVGLLMIPHSKIYENLDNNETLKDWGINPDCIEICTYKRAPLKSPKQVVRHIRNAVAHGNFEFKDEEGISLPIDHLILSDINKSGKTTFKATLEFTEFKAFVMKVAMETYEMLGNN